MPNRYTNIIKIALYCCLLLGVQALAETNLDKTLSDRIVKSTSELLLLEKKLSQESANYAKKIDKKQEDIKQLRAQAAAIQRLADEQTLGLEKLKSRVDQWSAQSNYQQQLISSYADSIGFTTADADESTPPNAALLDMAIKRLESLSHPQWQAQKIVTLSGSLADAQTLSIGPVNVALLTNTDIGGLTTKGQGDNAIISSPFNSSELKQLSEVKTSNAGFFSFDPTLGKAQELAKYDGGIFEHLEKGGFWVIPIVFFGLLSIIAATLKAAQFFHLPKIDIALADRLNDLIKQHHKQGISENTQKEFIQKLDQIAAKSGTPQQRLLQIARATAVSPERDDLLVAYLMEYRHAIEKYMGVVSTSAAIAPLLGLLGTVSGMISTFKMMTIFGTGDASTVSGGISVALITTELGLIVAIPSLVVSALLSRRAKSYAHGLESYAIKLSKIEFHQKELSIQ